MFLRQPTAADSSRSLLSAHKDEGFDAAAGNIRSVLKRLFDYAQTAGLVATNPVLALPMRHVHKAKARECALSPDEIRALLKAAFDQTVAHACDSTSACSSTVCVACSCLSGG
jgi:site-specific recombinase XerD